MRRTGHSGWMVRSSSKALRLSAVLLGVGLSMAAGAARAGDDEDDKTFEEKIVEGLMKGIGATNMENSGIDYRERSPLVVPPKLDLPPPVSASAEKTAPNWPKDPDEARRKAMIAARKKEGKGKTAEQAYYDEARPLSPSELNVARTKPGSSVKDSDSLKPGNSYANPLSPSQLGFDGTLFGLLKGGSTVESKEFKQEPPRESLVQPPSGYQTPSPNYVYGTGGKRETLYQDYDQSGTLQGKKPTQ